MSQPTTPGQAKSSGVKWSNFEKYLCGEYLEPNQELVLTITSVEVRELWSKKDKRMIPAPVLFFKETRQGLPLSISENRRMMHRLFGNDSQACVGQRIRLKMTPREVGGETKHPIYIVGKVTDPDPKPAPASLQSNPTAPKAAPARTPPTTPGTGK